MPSIARKNLFEDLPRFLVAQAGIMFAVSLITIQTGILQGVIRSIALLIDYSKADIWVGSQNAASLELTLHIPYERLNQAKKVEGVELAEPVILNGGNWRSFSGEINHVRVIGFEPDSQLFVPGEITRGSLSSLKEPYTFFIDEKNKDSLGVQWIGDRVEIGTFQAKLVGFTRNTQSTISSPFVFTSLKNANAIVTSPMTEEPSKLLAPDPEPLEPDDLITYVLIRAKPGQDLEELKQRLEKALPYSRAFTKAEFAQITRSYWQKRTGIGFVLGLGAIVGVVVGIVVVGQILYSSVSDHLKEFGTLKAMGASNLFIYSVIIEQSLWMAVLGYIPGMALCFGVKAWAFATQGLVILITPTTAASVFGITVLMCVGSALFAIQKVNRVDPAIVFKA